MTAQQGKLGIIAGGGDLPARLIEAAQASGRAVFVVALEGHANDPMLQTVPHTVVRLGAASRILGSLKAEKCEDVVLAGKVRRPSLAGIRPDWRGARMLMKMGLRALGDDDLLRLVGQELEKEGFRLVGVHDILTDLVTPEGVLGRVKPDDQAIRDAMHGLKIARLLGSADVGQGCVVQQGLVLALEAIEGTDEMVRRSALYARDGVGGVLIKSSKPQQDKRLDLPAIGTITIETAHKAGLRGVALLAGGTLIIDRDHVVDLANQYDLFVVGMTLDEANDPE
ncbi:LpxI family protein [Thalassospira sp.]|uniref:LpxI family protein n=1 Tax=Thalassospira sp. TaxID=1912094 RepID=UPI00273353D7|nr:UDP-2,3-diacylglucosamine diphosphatase LpxI [Thalassospira sp.]MDP2697787.1 UDP-2,3-diacylglucosamine diphosphatase LpxI [Thalassospira sp.]